jgi:ABC-type transporter lipoprotein component MlaA
VPSALLCRRLSDPEVCPWLRQPGADGDARCEFVGATLVDDFDYRSKLLPNTDALEKNSKDLYASIRLVKAQLRAKLVEEGKAGRVSSDEGSGAEAASR